MKSREELKNKKKGRTERSDTAVASAAITATFLSILSPFFFPIRSSTTAGSTRCDCCAGGTQPNETKNLFLIPKTP